MGVSPSPPRSGDIIGAAFVTVFLAGIAIGGVLFTGDSKPTQIAAHDALAAISLLNGVPPIRGCPAMQMHCLLRADSGHYSITSSAGAKSGPR